MGRFIDFVILAALLALAVLIALAVLDVPAEFHARMF